MSNNNLVWPDYTNCIANLPNSVLKYFGANTVGDTLPAADRLLDRDYKNIVVLLLDGMGISILERHLKEDGAFRKNLVTKYKSVFLSTTVAATTSVQSGLQPAEHSWLGWDCYFPQLDKNVTVFSNNLQGTDEPAADYHVAENYNPYESVVHILNKQGKCAYNCAPFIEPFPDTFDMFCEVIKEKCLEPEQKYIYAYWNQPDGLLHRNGCGAEIVRDTLVSMEEAVRRLSEELEDTLILVTADHGHTDSEYVAIQDYPEIMECLVRMPSLEPRVLNLFVKEDKKDFFEEEFNREFGDRFLLLTMEEVFEKKLMGTGTEHPHFRAMLGNYLAIATGNLSIFFDSKRWLSMHGSLTEDEMMIPLIALGRK